MAISQQNFAPVTKEQEDLLYKVILENDLSRLTPIEKVQHVKNVCISLGLNPLTKPIQLIKFQGKEIPYFTKDATEQLRKSNNISLSVKETQVIDDIYLVVVEAKTMDGRTDTSTGAVSLAGLKGADKANAFMKAETKAKRRATLSICGLGMLDESELDGLPQDKPNYKANVVPAKQVINDVPQVEFDQNKFDAYVYEMSLCKDLDSLKSKFTTAWRDPMIYTNSMAKNKLTSIKDKFVYEIINPKTKTEAVIDKEAVNEFIAEYDAQTGEVKHEAVV